MSEILHDDYVREMSKTELLMMAHLFRFKVDAKASREKLANTIILSREMLVSLFNHDSPLHDGGVVIRKGRILTAGCVLPLTKNPYISKNLGTRHRAAIGLSEETDAVIIVVSEETKQISLVQHGAITSGLDLQSLRNRLEAIFVPKTHQTHIWKNWLNRSGIIHRSSNGAGPKTGN